MNCFLQITDKKIVIFKNFVEKDTINSNEIKRLYREPDNVHDFHKTNVISQNIFSRMLKTKLSYS